MAKSKGSDLERVPINLFDAERAYELTKERRKREDKKRKAVAKGSEDSLSKSSDFSTIADFLAGDGKVSSEFTIQIGDKPGWKKPVLNVMREDGTSVAVSLLRREADELKELGVGVEG